MIPTYRTCTASADRRARCQSVFKRSGYRFAEQSSLRRLRRLVCGRKRVKTKISRDEARLLCCKVQGIALRLDVLQDGVLRAGMAYTGNIFDKGARRSFPGMFCGKFEAGLRRNPQGHETPGTQIVVNQADRRRTDTATWPG